MAEPRAAGLGYPRLHLRETTSTNALAKRLARAGAPDGTLVVADRQTAGRGRQGRGWWSPPGGLWCSLVLRHEQAAPLSLVAAVAVCRAIPTKAGIKWPNDVLIPRADGSLGKVCGILVEQGGHGGWAVVGVGLNVAGEPSQAPAELRPRIATLGLAAEARWSLLERLLDELEALLALPPEGVLEEWRRFDLLRDREVVAEAGGRLLEGRARSIDGRGRLVVETTQGTVALEGGEVHLMGGAGLGGGATER